jgi:tetratricopeptide (TPR) repeat protein
MVEPTPADEQAAALRDLIASGRFQEALEAFRRARRAGAVLDAEAGLLAATAATRLGDLAAGESLALGALDGFRARADDDGHMRIQNLLGAIAFERGDLPRAGTCFEHALRLANRLGDSLMEARITNNLASVSHLRGDLAGALRLYRSALAGFQRLGDRRYIAETYHNLALAFRQAADYHEAESAAAQAIRHADVLDDVTLRALAVTGRAELRVEQGETAFAYQELDRAGRLASDAGDHIGGAEVRRVRALAALKERRYEFAAAEAEAARTVALEHRSALLAVECSAVAALAYRGAGNVELAADRRAHAMAGLRDLGATQLLERLEREWADSGPVGPPLS